MKPIEQRLCEMLDERTESLDGRSLSRLRQARAQAVAAADASWVTRFPFLLAPAAGLGILGLIGLMYLRFPGNGIQDPPLPVTGDLDVATLEVEVDLVEDLEFYQWLEQHSTPRT